MTSLFPNTKEWFDSTKFKHLDLIVLLMVHASKIFLQKKSGVFFSYAKEGVMLRLLGENSSCSKCSFSLHILKLKNLFMLEVKICKRPWNVCRINTVFTNCRLFISMMNSTKSKKRFYFLGSEAGSLGSEKWKLDWIREELLKKLFHFHLFMKNFYELFISSFR